MAATNTTVTAGDVANASTITVAVGDTIQCVEGRVRVSSVNTDQTGGIVLDDPRYMIQAKNAGTVYLWLASGNSARVVSVPI